MNEQRIRTITRPAQPIPKLRPLSKDLKPHIPAPIPRLRALAIGNPRHIKLQRPRMPNRRANGEPNSRAGGDAHGLRTRTVGVLVAADGLAVDVGNGSVVLEVFGAPDVFPVAGCGAVGDQGWEGIWSYNYQHDSNGGVWKKETDSGRWRRQPGQG